MKIYLILFGHGITRHIIARDPFEALRTALGTLTIVDQMVITTTEFRITCKRGAA